jgi:spore coat protein U-like protein
VKSYGVLLAALHRYRRHLWVAAFATGFALPCYGAATCTVSATPAAFGVYNPLTAAATVSTATVTTTCTWISGGATRADIVSSYSTGSSGTFATRTMLSGANSLSYNLYFDTTYTQVGGDGTGGSQTAFASLIVSNGQKTRSTSSTIYARVPALQDVAAGTYSDTITVTITY